jgi:hypothetical protein
MRARCRCFGGPEQARLIIVTCLYFDVCFILRRRRSRTIDFAFPRSASMSPNDSATGPALFAGFIEVVATPTEPGLMNWVYDQFAWGSLGGHLSNTSHRYPCPFERPVW